MFFVMSARCKGFSDKITQHCEEEIEMAIPFNHKAIEKKVA